MTQCDVPEFFANDEGLKRTVEVIQAGTCTGRIGVGKVFPLNRVPRVRVRIGDVGGEAVA